MSKSRSIGKYAIASAVTGLYAGAIYKAYKEPDLPRQSPERIAIAALILTGSMWVVAAL